MTGSVLLFGGINSRAGKRLEECVSRVVPYEHLEVFHDFDGLAQRLHQCLLDLRVAVLHAQTRKDLANLLSLRQFFADIRVILVLPDRSSATVKTGLRLKPRYLDYADSDFCHIEEVLTKIWQRFAL